MKTYKKNRNLCLVTFSMAVLTILAAMFLAFNLFSANHITEENERLENLYGSECLWLTYSVNVLLLIIVIAFAGFMFKISKRYLQKARATHP
jgi:uncharacterized membrane protein